MLTSSRTLGPTRSPIETNRIAGVIGDPDSRFETAATAISASATIVSDHSIQIRSITVDRRLQPIAQDDARIWRRPSQRREPC
jgi:hypothetical protein